MNNTNSLYHFAIFPLLFKQLNIRVTKSLIKKTLETHPDYPSLLAVSDMLSDFNVDNLTARIKKDDLDNIEPPFLAHITQPEDQIVLVNKIEDNKIKYLDFKNKWVTQSVTEFKSNWDGMVMLMETNDKSGDHNYRGNNNQETLLRARIPFTIAIVIILLLLSFLLGGTMSAAIFTSLKVAGIGVSILLILNSIGEPNIIANKLCSIGNKTSCNEVLNSPAGTLFGWLQMSDIGLIYFTGGLFSLMISMSNQSTPITMQLLFILSFFSLPYTVFSIYYQAMVIKKWCTLCLAVVFLLWAEGVYSFFNFNPIYFTNINSSALFSFLLGFAIPISFWIFFKKHLIESKMLQAYEASNYKLKYNVNIFKSLLTQAKPVDLELHPNDIIIGNLTAPYLITVVVNPYCVPCASAHKKMEELLDYYPEKVKVLIRFNGNLNGEKERQNIAAATLIDLYTKLDNEQFKKSFNEWFNINNYEEFIKLYKEADVANGLIDLDRHIAWVKKTDIAFTPTFFMGNYTLPDLYSVNDLKKIIRLLLQEEGL